VRDLVLLVWIAEMFLAGEELREDLCNPPIVCAPHFTDGITNNNAMFT